MGIIDSGRATRYLYIITLIKKIPFESHFSSDGASGKTRGASQKKNEKKKM